MDSYFLGIDNGGSLTKAVLFDLRGQEIASASARVPLIQPQPGFTERDMEVLWQANVTVIREVLAKAGIAASAIAGIACTGHGKGLYLWGDNDRPAANGIVSTDSRAWAYPLQWQQDGTAEAVFAKTLQTPLACQPVALWRWFQTHRPEVLSTVRWVFSVKDYIRFRLTGEAWSEITDASGTSLMDLQRAAFDTEVINAFGINGIAAKLPPLRLSTDCCGAITAEASACTGLSQGTPVAGGMFDIDACAVAMNVTDERYLCVIAGTWGINEYVSRQPVLNKSIRMNSLFCIPDRFLIEESSPTSASNNDWFSTLFLDSERREAEQRGISLHALAEELAASVAHDAQSILFLPFLYGSNDNPLAKASFIGLESTHTRPQLIRAVLEGIVFSHRVHIERLLANRNAPEAIRLAGGAANNRVWAQIFADAIGLPIDIVATRELGALGCAMAAAVATGHYADFASAAEQMVTVKARLQPDPDKKAAYDHKYGLFVKAAQALDGLWREFSNR